MMSTMSRTRWTGGSSGSRLSRLAAAACAALAAGVVAAAGADRAGAIDLSAASGSDLAVAAADGDLGVLRGHAGNRRSGAFLVDSVEMSPSLGRGDILLYDRQAYRAAAPARGEVVVFRPRREQAAACGSAAERIARVVGVPGDVVRLDGLGVSVNGAPLQVAGAGRPTRNRT